MHTVIYHGNCVDGFTAAWVARNYLENHPNEVNYIPVNYGEDYSKLEPYIKDAYVKVLDFSFPRSLMEHFHSIAKLFEVHDHHKTAQEECKDLSYCTFDMKRSGAMLAWDRFFPYTTPPLLVRYVQDHDLWTWRTPEALQYSEQVNAVIHTRPKTWDQWDTLNCMIETSLIDIVKEGNILLNKDNALRYHS